MSGVFRRPIHERVITRKVRLRPHFRTQPPFALVAAASITFAGTQTLTALGTLTAAGSFEFADTVSLTAGGALSAAAAVTFTETLTLTALGALQGTITVTFTDQADLQDGNESGSMAFLAPLATARYKHILAR